MNTDQGSQFISFAWTDRQKRAGTRISMDGKGRCIDNVFVERLWRSLKYECVYLHDWATGSQAKAGITRWMPTPPAFIAWRHPTRGGLSAGNQRKPTRSAGAKGNLTQPVNCPKYWE
jgi:transposase InsO family protein